MANDDFEPFRGLHITRDQDAEIRAYIEHKLARDEPWDTLGLSCMLKNMLAPLSAEDGCTSPVVIVPGQPRGVR
jgi:hypothetical protein